MMIAISDAISKGQLTQIYLELLSTIWFTFYLLTIRETEDWNNLYLFSNSNITDYSQRKTQSLSQCDFPLPIIGQNKTKLINHHRCNFKDKYSIFCFQNWHLGGAHWVLMWHLTRRGLCQCLMPDYARRCRTSTLIMVPINFWRNSDPFKKKEHFSSSKNDRVRAFFANLSNFQK